MKFGKTELIRRISDVVRNGWSNVHLRDLIESLWRDPFSMRTSGFVHEGGTDSLLAAEVTSTEVDGITSYTIVVTITPKTKKFDFYQFREILTYHKKYDSESIAFDAEEGLHAVYYDFDEETNEQVLKHIKDPDHDDMLELMQWVVPITFIYFDNDKKEITYFGNNRHGSWWNPWIHFVWHQTMNSQRETGLEFTDLVADGDGSSDTHAQFGIMEGSCFHEDIYVISEGIVVPANIPVWYFKQGSKPRIHASSSNSLVVDGLLCCNSGGTVIPATEGWFVMYHIFFTNDILEPFISVMGQDQYEKVSTATLMINSEIQQVKDLLPHANMLHIGTLLFQTSINFTNSYHSRLVKQAWGVITRWSVTGDGSAATPVQFKNDEETPEAGKVYGTHYQTGEKGYHALDPRLFGWGSAIYLYAEPSDITGYNCALPVIPIDDSATYTAQSNNGEEVLIKSFITDPLYPENVEIIPSGVWTFETWAAVATNDQNFLVIRVFSFDESEVETELFSIEQQITAVGISVVSKYITQNDILFGAGKRIVVKYFHKCLSSTLRTMYLGIQGDQPGAIWLSNFRLPIQPFVEPNHQQSDWNETDENSQAFIWNKPAIPDGQIQSDWSQTNNQLLDFIKNKPAIPEAQVQSDWEQIDDGEPDFIKNKPTLPDDYEYWTLVAGTKEAMVVKYGYLYNWWAINDSRCIAPEGWHVPSITEFETLRDYIGITDAGTKLKESGTDHWNTPNDGTDDYGFALRGSGIRYGANGTFGQLKEESILGASNQSYGRLQGFECYNESPYFFLYIAGNEAGVSIRLIKDDSTNTGIMEGNDGKIYQTVKIGNQVWMAENLMETKYKNQDSISGPTYTDEQWVALTTEAYCIYNDTASNAGTLDTVDNSVNVYKHDIVEFAGDGVTVEVEEISATRKKVTITIP